MAWFPWLPLVFLINGEAGVKMFCPDVRLSWCFCNWLGIVFNRCNWLGINGEAGVGVFVIGLVSMASPGIFNKW